MFGKVTLEVKWVRVRVRVRSDAKNEFVGNGVKAKHQIINKGYENFVAITECTN
jgi:hypothetical protein